MMPTLEFNEERWRRVGATDAQVADKRSQWDAFTGDDQKAAELQRMASLADTDLAAELGQAVQTPQRPAQPPQPPVQPGA